MGERGGGGPGGGGSGGGGGRRRHARRHGRGGGGGGGVPGQVEVAREHLGRGAVMHSCVHSHATHHVGVMS